MHRKIGIRRRSGFARIENRKNRIRPGINTKDNPRGSQGTRQLALCIDS